MIVPTGKVSEFSAGIRKYQNWDNYPDSPVPTYEYPYQVIVVDSSSNPTLYLSKTPFRGISTGNGNGTTVLYARFNDGIWSLSDSFLTGYGLNNTNTEANNDIYRDDSLTTVMFPETVPILIGTVFTIDSITQPTEMTYQVNISETILDTDIVTCDYTEGTVKSIDGGTLASFSTSVVYGKTLTIPSYYILATDEDFSGTTDGDFRYIGTDEYVQIPDTIKGVTVTSTCSMFESTGVLGVATDYLPIVDTSDMFSSCTSTSLELTYFDTSNVTDMNSMFFGCHDLISIDLTNFDTTNVTDISNMFNECWVLTSLDLTNFNTTNVTDMNYMFYECYVLTSLDLTNFNTTNVTNMRGLINRCWALTSLDLSNFNTTNVTNMRSMFSGSHKLISIDLSSFDTTSVTDMSYMFFNCYSLTSLDTTNFDTSNVTDMSVMFLGCSSLTSFDLTNFDTSNVTDMNGMFFGCYDLISLDLTNFNTTNVTNMKTMFYECHSLISLDVTNFNTTNVTDMNYMFAECYVLTSLDVTNFNTTNVTNMSWMFFRCTSLTILDLSSFYTNTSINGDIMFSNCYNITTAYARTQTDADFFNDTRSKPTTFTFVVM